MPDFLEVVRLAQESSGMTQLRPVVEKEILHHTIIRSMAEAGLLHRLTFIGGTCLRACYGSNRLSEDLDFTGGSDFTIKSLTDLGRTVADGVRKTYGLDLVVSPPRREDGNVSTWKLQVITHPGNRHLPRQRIHIYICAVSSGERRPAVLRNPYGVDLGTSGLILQAESRREILVDKVLALALRPNRIKPRDLWDIAWLRQQGETCDPTMVWGKCQERQVAAPAFRQALSDRLMGIPDLQATFAAEMARFLPQQVRQTSIDQPGFWDYLSDTVRETCRTTLTGDGEEQTVGFRF
jgi:predicted nucleotidyltransferase component of viral defense system